MKKRKIGWYWTRYFRQWGVLYWDGEVWMFGAEIESPEPDEIDERRIVRQKDKP